MEYSGYVERGCYDEVVFRGDVATGEFIAFWMGAGRVLAGMNVNVPRLLSQLYAESNERSPCPSLPT